MTGFYIFGLISRDAARDSRCSLMLAMRDRDTPVNQSRGSVYVISPATVAPGNGTAQEWRILIASREREQQDRLSFSVSCNGRATWRVRTAASRKLSFLWRTYGR
jgi:hypothetical protein